MTAYQRLPLRATYPFMAGPPSGSARFANPVEGSVEAHPDAGARLNQPHRPIDEPIDLTADESVVACKRAVCPAFAVNIGCHLHAIEPAFKGARLAIAGRGIRTVSVGRCTQSSSA